MMMMMMIMEKQRKKRRVVVDDNGDDFFVLFCSSLCSLIPSMDSLILESWYLKREIRISLSFNG